MYSKKHNKTNPNLVLRNDLFCRFCGKECKNLNSLKQHECRCRDNPNRKSVDNLSNRGWAKGLNKNNDIRIRNASISKKDYYKTHLGTFTGKHHSEETKNHLSVKLTEYNHSNNRRNSHGKHGYFNGIYFMSTWELAYYIFSKEHNHKIARCNERFKYVWKDKYHYYTPDFIEDGIFIEVKGWETELDKVKYETVGNLKVIYYADIKPMIKFVQELYHVEDISSLYEGG